MQPRSKPAKHAMFKLKDRTTTTLPSISLFSNDDKDNHYTDEELATINDLVQKRRADRKVYSKTLIETYTPLTKLEKVKVIKDMDESSTNRFKQYSNLFDQIKQQIHDINNSLIETKTDNKDNLLRISMRKTMHLTDNVEFIEEKDEEDFLSPKYVIRSTPKIPFDCYFDQETFSENISSISLRDSPIQNSSILLVQSKQKQMSYSKDNMSFIKAREELKRIKVRNKKELSDICYCESINNEVNGDKYCSNHTQYCNCIIQ